MASNQKWDKAKLMRVVDSDVYKTKAQRDAYRARLNKAMWANWEVFKKRERRLLKKHHGQYALFNDGKICGYFDNRQDARNEGIKRFGDDGPENFFFAFEIGKKPIELGFHTSFRAAYQSTS